MSINDIPGLSVLRTKMQWHQERQRVLSENVSNSDTPNFRPRDLVEPTFDATGASVGSMGEAEPLFGAAARAAGANALECAEPPFTGVPVGMGAGIGLGGVAAVAA